MHLQNIPTGIFTTRESIQVKLKSVILISWWWQNRFIGDCHHKFAFLGQRDQIRFWQKWNVQFLETWNSDQLILFLLPFIYSTPFHLFPRCSGSDWNFDNSYLLSYRRLPGGALRRANQSTRWQYRLEISLWQKFHAMKKPKRRTRHDLQSLWWHTWRRHHHIILIRFYKNIDFIILQILFSRFFVWCHCSKNFSIRYKSFILIGQFNSDICYLALWKN